MQKYKLQNYCLPFSIQRSFTLLVSFYYFWLRLQLWWRHRFWITNIIGTSRAHQVRIEWQLSLPFISLSLSLCYVSLVERLWPKYFDSMEWMKGSWYKALDMTWYDDACVDWIETFVIWFEDFELKICLAMPKTGLTSYIDAI